jgi:hypothetical protein
MELKNFIEKALLEITDAVYNARKKSKSTIAPSFLHYEDKKIVCDEMNYIEFDIATHVVNKPSKSGKIDAKISVIAFSASMSGDISTKIERNEISRIKFKVPVALNASPRREPASDES